MWSRLASNSQVPGITDVPSPVYPSIFFFCGCKWSLLKVREEKYKGNRGGAQVEAGSQESIHLFFFLKKQVFIEYLV
jgi:hypothetical protein